MNVKLVIQDLSIWSTNRSASHLCLFLSPFSALLPPEKAFCAIFELAATVLVLALLELDPTFDVSQLAPPTPSDSQASFTPEKSSYRD